MLISGNQNMMKVTTEIYSTPAKFDKVMRQYDKTHAKKYRHSHNRVLIKRHIYQNISLISKSKTLCLIQECYMKANSFNLQSAEKRKNSSLRN